MPKDATKKTTLARLVTLRAVPGDARRLVAERPLAFEARLGEAARVPEPDARPFDEVPGPAVNAFLAFVAALPIVGAAAA